MEEDTAQLESSARSHLEALNCLAATAGKLINNEQEIPNNISHTSFISTEQEVLHNPRPFNTSNNCLAQSNPNNTQETEMTNFHLNGFLIPTPLSSPKTSIFASECRPPSIFTSPKSNLNSLYETENYIYNQMTLPTNQCEYRPQCLDNSIYSNTNNNKVNEKPPLLFGMDSLLTDSSLFETLVQESHKMLLKEENENSISNIKSSDTFINKYSENLKTSDETTTSLGDIKTKSFKKGRVKNINITDKKNHGGPPFKPGCSPPKKNTPESALCTFHEHTLLKMATRGFWSGDKGPLQDVFRLARVENSDLHYSMKDITEHCYNIVKTKLEAVENSVRKSMYLHMKNYVSEFDSYLNRIYPVSSVAINIYLPTAVDYAAATWHGIVPTGWSEYRRAVVIREVFEVIYHLSLYLPELPEFHSSFFDKPNSDQTLFSIDLPNSPFVKPKDSKEPKKQAKDILKENANYSRVFEALWNRLAPHQPFLILSENVQVKLQDYFEEFPLELFAPPEHAVIVVDKKKFKAREVLGYFRRGVQLVDYSKDTGSTVIDTVSTLRNFSITSAVRKIPPGKISKLVHIDLHLENYTNPIIEINNDNARDFSPMTKVKNRKRKIKAYKPNNIKKVTDDSKSIETSESNIKLQSISTFCNSLASENHNNLGNDYKVDLNLQANLNLSTPPEQFSCYPYAATPTENRDFFLPGSKNKFSRPTNFCKQFSEPAIESMFDREASLLRPKHEHHDAYTPDILSPMHFLPTSNSGEMLSLHLMIDSYRRAAKYLLDTANHLELVARRTSTSSVHLKKESESRL
ncbi:uncharacterized protein LOC124817314 [Hydra vulgaris]|uniref:uncharacterized protein LOC124817314 n=1 Tax=Hydra vulgaris TaxID=6087 RepID=UPI001F5F577D|nr:uncharacterized protein LOC124817314 [Hydra vulgaris]